MKISGLEVVRSRPNILEETIVAICDHHDTVIEFSSDFDPEVKLRLIYEQLTEIERRDDRVLGEERELSSRLFIDTIFGIMRRHDVDNNSFNKFYYLILAIELIKPGDPNNILRTLIQERKFINLIEPNGDINLHIRLVDVYLNLVTDSESINFICEYLYAEFKNGELFKYPVFFVLFLRSLLRFRHQNDYFWGLEVCVQFCGDRSQFVRLVISIDEYIRTKRGYAELYRWLNRDCTKLLDEFKVKIIQFVSELKLWASRRKVFDNNHYLDLILAEISLMLGNNMKESIGYLKAFSDLNEDSFHTNEIGREFTNMLKSIGERGYIITDEPLDSHTTAIFIVRSIEDVFQPSEVPYFIKIPNNLYRVYAKRMYPNVTLNPLYSFSAQ